MFRVSGLGLLGNMGTCYMGIVGVVSPYSLVTPSKAMQGPGSPKTLSPKVKPLEHKAQVCGVHPCVGSKHGCHRRIHVEILT